MLMLLLLILPPRVICLLCHRVERRNVACSVISVIFSSKFARLCVIYAFVSVDVGVVISSKLLYRIINWHLFHIFVKLLDTVKAFGRRLIESACDIGLNFSTIIILELGFFTIFELIVEGDVHDC